MTILDLLILLLVAGVCGAIGQAITGYRAGGCLASIDLGFIGALLGFWISRQLKLPEPLVIQVGDMPFLVVWSIAGAALFVAVISLSARRRRGPWTAGTKTLPSRVRTAGEAFCSSFGGGGRETSMVDPPEV